MSDDGERIEEGTPVYLITTVSDEYDGTPYIDIRTAPYDSRWMHKLLGTRVFKISQRESADKALEYIRLTALMHDRGLERTHEIHDGMIVPKGWRNSHE